MCDISVIIPIYNCEKYIEKCIHSLQNQSLKDIELIVVNDGSTDRSQEIVEDLARNDSRIILLNQANAGTSVARNNGIRQAKGDYIAFVDGDDYLREDYLALLHQCAVQYRSQIVIGGITYVDERGNCIQEIVPEHYQRFSHEEWAMRISAAAAHLYERRFWVEHNLYFSPKERGEDIPIALYCNAECKNISVVDAPGYYYLQHSESAMSSMKGLKDYTLPYSGMKDMLQRIHEEGIVNSKEFHELFVLRILSTFLFVLAPGSSKKQMNQLYLFIEDILETYYPNYHQNPYISLFNRLDYPFVQKLSVRLFVFSCKHDKLRLLSKILSGFNNK